MNPFYPELRRKYVRNKNRKTYKKYKEKTAVSNLDLKINEGEMYGLLGVNGAGKTTTMKMLTTLIMPTSGEAELLGHSIKPTEQR